MSEAKLKNLDERVSALEHTVDALKTEVQTSNEWSKRNHDSLNFLVEFAQGMENARKLADTTMRWGRPLAWVAATASVMWMWGKAFLTTVLTHLAAWAPK